MSTSSRDGVLLDLLGHVRSAIEHLLCGTILGVQGTVLVGSWLAAALSASPEVAEPPRPASYALDWTAPAACPDKDALERQIEGLLEGAPGGEGQMYVDARVTHARGRFTLEVTTQFMGETDTRAPMTSTRCDDLSDAVSLLVAVALEPAAAARGPQTRGPSQAQVPDPVEPARPRAEPGTIDRTPPTSDATPSSRARPPRAPVPAPDPIETDRPVADRSNVHGVARLDLAFVVGALPRPGGATLGAIGLVWPRVRLEVFGAYLWPTRNRSATGLFALGAVGLRTCGRLRAQRVEFPLCGGVEAGAIRADSRRLQPPRRAHGAWVAVLAGAGVAWRSKRIGVFVLAEPGVPVVRTRFLVGEQVVFRSSIVTFRATGGVEFFFG